MPSSVQEFVKRYLEPLVGPRNAQLLAGMIEDALWLLIVGIIFRLVLSPIFHLVFGESDLLVLAEEGLYFVGVIAFFWGAVLRTIDWFKGGNGW